MMTPFEYLQGVRVRIKYDGGLVVDTVVPISDEEAGWYLPVLKGVTRVDVETEPIILYEARQPMHGVEDF